MTDQEWFFRLYQDFWDPATNPLIQLGDDRAAMLYLKMLTGKQISFAGVLTYSPAALARDTFGWTETQVEGLLATLEQHGDVLIDTRDHEILLPRAIRETRIMTLRHGLSMVSRSLGAITSPRVRIRLADELTTMRDDPELTARREAGTARRREAIDGWIAQLRGTAPRQSSATLTPSEDPSSGGALTAPAEGVAHHDGHPSEWGIAPENPSGGIPYAARGSVPISPPNGPPPAQYGMAPPATSGGLPYRPPMEAQAHAQSAFVMPAGASLSVALPTGAIPYAAQEPPKGGERVETREPLPAVVGAPSGAASQTNQTPSRPTLTVVDSEPAGNVQELVAAYVEEYKKVNGRRPISGTAEQIGRQAKKLLREVAHDELLRACALAGANQWTNLAMVVEVERSKGGPPRPGAGRLASLEGGADYDPEVQP